MEIQKIDDMPNPDAVHQISQRPAQNQAQSKAEKHLTLMLFEKIQYQDGGRCRDEDEQPPLPSARIVEEIESRPLVIDEHQIEKRCKHDLPPIGECTHDLELARLIEKNDDEAQTQPARPFKHGASLRLHRKDCSRSARRSWDGRGRSRHPRGNANNVRICRGGLRSPEFSLPWIRPVS